MKSLLHSLTGSESVLLMYLADELPPEDRADVEGMLAIDAGLRSQLEVLRATYESSMGLIEQADKDGAKRSRSVQNARRNAVRLVNQWNLQKSIDRPVPKPVSSVRKWVIYPAAGVAAALFVGLILWGLFGPTPTVQNPDPINIAADVDREAFDELQKSLTRTDETISEPTDAVASLDPGAEDLLVNSLDTTDDLILDATLYQHLGDAERQLLRVNRLSEDQ